MGNSIHNREEQKQYIQQRMNMLLTVLDSLDPDKAELEDMDRLIEMIENLEFKVKQFKKDWEKEENGEG